jgi:predicted ArsR family transcriptional regulator
VVEFGKGGEIMLDICPIMSIGKPKPVNCTSNCAWFDTNLEECAMSRINANLKYLQDIANCPDVIIPDNIVKEYGK